MFCHFKCCFDLFGACKFLLSLGGFREESYARASLHGVGFDGIQVKVGIDCLCLELYLCVWTGVMSVWSAKYMKVAQSGLFFSSSQGVSLSGRSDKEVTHFKWVLAYFFRSPI